MRQLWRWDKCAKTTEVTEDRAVININVKRHLATQCRSFEDAINAQRYLWSSRKWKVINEIVKRYLATQCGTCEDKISIQRLKVKAGVGSHSMEKFALNSSIESANLVFKNILPIITNKSPSIKVSSQSKSLMILNSLLC